MFKKTVVVIFFYILTVYLLGHVINTYFPNLYSFIGIGTTVPFNQDIGVGFIILTLVMILIESFVILKDLINEIIHWNNDLAVNWEDVRIVQNNINEEKRND